MWDDPGPRPVRRPRGRRRACRRARRGDGVRGARARPSCSARPPGGSRTSRATACSSRPRPACPVSPRSGRGRCRPPRGAGGEDRQGGSRARSARRRRCDRRVEAEYGSTRSPLGTSSRSSASRRVQPASSRPTGRSSSSASATRSATGACASCRRSRPCARSVGDGAAGAAPRIARARRAVAVVGRRHRAPLPRRRRATAARRPCSSRARSRISSSASLRSPRCTGHGSGRTRPARCSSRGGRDSARRSGSSG